MLKILAVPEATEILRRKSEAVEKIDAEAAAFLTELGETLKSQKNPAGVGLSAIQVGRPIRAFATLLPDTKDTEPKGPTLPRQGRTLSKKPQLTFYINPEITGHSDEMTLGYDLVPTRLPRPDQRSGLAMTAPHQRINASTHQPFLEGCLSIPRIYGAVLRYPWIKASAAVFSETDLRSPLALSPHPLALTLDALASRVFQHEIDHLNGVLFTDHVLAQGNQLYREEGKELVEMAM